MAQYTVSTVAKRLGKRRQRIHQLIRELGITPKVIEDADGEPALYLLSEAHVARMERFLADHGRDRTRKFA